MVVPTFSFDIKNRDEQLLQEWRDAAPGFNRDQKLEALLGQLNGAIQAAVGTYRAAPLPGATLELEGKRVAVQALKEWDKAKGMSLASYVSTMVRQRLYRFVATYQNVGRLPEAQVRQIGVFNRANTDLRDRFGRDATTEELADHLALPVSHVTRLRKSLRKDLLDSAFEDEDGLEAIAHDPAYERTMMGYYSLTDQEKTVFDYLLGAHGQPKLDPGAIAKRLSVAPSRVSAIKESIGTKLSPYLHG